MILYTEEQFKQIQLDNIIIIKKYISNCNMLLYTNTNDILEIESALNNILKVVLMGRLSYSHILEYTIKIIENPTLLNFFTVVHNKQEVRNFLLSTLQEVNHF